MRLKNYALVTAGYWAYTITDGALRMLVLLYFHDLGYSPVSIAFLFLAYEFMGIVTNLIGGWVGARTGLNRTLIAGLGLQIVALVALTLQQVDWREWVTVVYVMAAQALSGVAKDLTKMSSKSAVKFVAGDQEGALFRMVAILTGSKNALKGVGFFIGAALLAWLGYDAALWTLAALIAVTLGVVAVMLDEDIGKSKKKPPLRSILSKSDAINRLSFARFFLFSSRDIWFVVALPIFLDERFGWSFYGIGGFLAAWIVGYGIVQSAAPKWLHRGQARGRPRADEIKAARTWALALGIISAAIATAVGLDIAITFAVVGGLIVFGVAFALNSSLHSYLILAYADDDDVSLDVGFYYSANAAGRLVGTMLSGVLYLWGGLELALWGSTAFLAITWLLTLRLPAIEVRRPALV
ncbi:MAG: organoarsenical effux MFS transporter ArsJ [Ilumatobacter sp.]|uniref:organoarsenical effux MFS transporter ArsJ n=1 Tax=Ilumatobacter sp. TaxID=1967498 RepID=UPI00391BFBD6